MSPLVWDLAHIGNQEELWLLRNLGGREPMHPEIDPLYDAFEHPRAERPTLPLLPPGRGPALRPRGARPGAGPAGAAPLAETRLLSRGGFAFGMIAQHEQQHDETMLITHQLRSGRAGAAPPRAARAAGRRARAAGRGASSPAGRSPWAPRPSPGRWTTSGPAHEVDVAGFWLDTTPVTNGAYTAVHRRRRLRRPALVDPRPAGSTGRRPGWPPRCTGRAEGGQWLRRRFGVVEPVPADEPVVHVS